MTQTGKSRTKEAAVTALLAARSLDDAARQANVSTRTLLRWLKDENFVSSYKKAQERLLESAINSLRQSALVFAETLRAVCEDPATPAGAKATAARSGLEVLLRAAIFDDLRQRVERLEKSAATLRR